jgi:hypothetical protein
MIMAVVILPRRIRFRLLTHGQMRCPRAGFFQRGRETAVRTCHQPDRIANARHAGSEA